MNVETKTTVSSATQISKTSLTIGHNCKLTLQQAKQFVTEKTKVALSQKSHAAMSCSYQFLQSCVDQRMPIYGVNTNFGDQVHFLDPNLKADGEIYYQSIQARQKNIIKSMACSVGETVPLPIVKTTMLLRAHCLAQGYSGVSKEAVEAILAFLNAGIVPVVRRYGSIGASGDLIPLASLAAAIIGEEVDVWYQGEIMKAPQAIAFAGLQKFIPQMRDGIALINGTSFMTAIASLGLYDLKRLFMQMLYAVAMSLESMLVISSAYHPLVHQLKNHVGSNIVNDILKDFWEGSQLLSNLDEIRTCNFVNAAKTENVKSVQDYYSLRSVPQGFGPLQENLVRAVTWVEEEMNSVNDNPVIDAMHRQIYHGANFMGHYVTDACDMLKMDIAQASTWIHALLANMVHPRKNQNLPTNLVEDPVKNNGFRSLQILAAALAVQNRKLAQAHQAFMLPTEGDNQDVNSLGTHAAFDLQEAVANLERLTAILLLSSVQALELRGIEKAGIKSRRIYQTIREHSATLMSCRPMTDELNTVIELLKAEKI